MEKFYLPEKRAEFHGHDGRTNDGDVAAARASVQARRDDRDEAHAALTWLQRFRHQIGVRVRASETQYLRADYHGPRYQGQVSADR